MQPIAGKVSGDQFSAIVRREPIACNGRLVNRITRAGFVQSPGTGTRQATIRGSWDFSAGATVPLTRAAARATDARVRRCEKPGVPSTCRGSSVTLPANDRAQAPLAGYAELGQLRINHLFDSSAFSRVQTWLGTMQAVPHNDPATPASSLWAPSAPGPKR